MISSASPRGDKLRAPGPSGTAESICCELGVHGENAHESCPVELEAEPDTRNGSGNPVEGASKSVEGGRSASGGIS